MKTFFLKIAACIGLVPYCNLPVARVADDTSGSLVWATPGNWIGGSAPGAGNTATFNGVGNGNTTIDL